MKNKNNTHLRKVGTQYEEAEKVCLSIAASRKILKEDGEGLSDEAIVQIRNYFYCLAAITMQQYQNEKTNNATVINLEHYKTITDEESHYLRAG